MHVNNPISIHIFPHYREFLTVPYNASQDTHDAHQQTGPPLRQTPTCSCAVQVEWRWNLQQIVVSFDLDVESCVSDVNC